MRYIVTIGEHTKHVFRVGEIILPRKLMRFEVHDAIILYAFSKIADKEKEDFILKNVKEAKEKFETKNIPCLVKEVKEPYNFSRNVIEFRKLIKPKTTINITGGRRIIGIELFYAAILEKDKLLSVFYVSDEGEVIELPLVEPGEKLSRLETEILEVLKEGSLSVSEIAYRLQRKVPLISQYIAKLEAKGYIKREKTGKRVFVERVL